MLQAANSDLFRPLIPKAHNSERIFIFFQPSELMGYS